MSKKPNRPWEGTEQDAWRRKIKPRWGFLSVNGKGYLYHHFKPLRKSKSLGRLLSYQTEKELQRRVRKSDRHFGRLVGGKGSPDRTIKAGIQRYRDHLSIRHKNGRITRSTYDTYLVWIDFHEGGLFRERRETPLARFQISSNEKEVRRFFLDYFKSRTKRTNKRGRAISDVTLRKELSRLRMFFKFLKDEGMMAENPIEQIGDWLEDKIKELTPHRDDAITKSEMVDRYDRWKRIRAHLISEWDRTRLVSSTSERLFLIQALMGMRVSEVRRMEWAEFKAKAAATRDVRTLVSDDLSELRITSKGKTRTRPVPSKVREVLAEIRTEQLKEFVQLPRWVLYSPYRHGGDPERTQPMSLSSVSNGFKRFQRKIGEEKPLLRTHELRSFFITDLIERGAPEREVSLFVGHSSIKMTRYYLRDEVLPSDNVISMVEDAITEVEE